MEDRVILVDIFDNQIGSGEKMRVHREGRLHRAFSVFLYDGKENADSAKKSGEISFRRALGKCLLFPPKRPGDAGRSRGQKNVGRTGNSA